MPIAADIYYQIFEGGEVGQRPPLILIHGAGGTHLHWPSEIRRLPGYRVYSLDLPGHGKSTGRSQQTIAGYAHQVADWLEAANLHSAVFAGHSMGSAIALSLALDDPGHVLGLALIGASARLQVNPMLLAGAASVSTFPKAIEAVMSWSFSPKAPARLVEICSRRMAETRPSVLHSDFLACDAFDAASRLGEVSQPALVVCGEDDRMTPLRSAQFLAAGIPNARLEVISGAGHMVMIEHPSAVASALRRFLDDISI
jgi:pimeloyl-ACP methyl ester carboxylesterase